MCSDERTTADGCDLLSLQLRQSLVCLHATGLIQCNVLLALRTMLQVPVRLTVTQVVEGFGMEHERTVSRTPLPGARRNEEKRTLSLDLSSIQREAWEERQSFLQTRFCSAMLPQ